MRQHHHRSSRAAFEKAVGLVRLCNQKFTEAEKKAELLVKDKEGKLQLNPFEDVSEGDEDD